MMKFFFFVILSLSHNISDFSEQSIILNLFPTFNPLPIHFSTSLIPINFCISFYSISYHLLCHHLYFYYFLNLCKKVNKDIGST